MLLVEARCQDRALLPHRHPGGEAMAREEEVERLAGATAALEHIVDRRHDVVLRRNAVAWIAPVGAGRQKAKILLRHGAAVLLAHPGAEELGVAHGARELQRVV